MNHSYAMKLHSRELRSRSFLSIQLLNDFLFGIQFITCFFNYVFYSKLFLICFLDFFFITTSSNWFTIQITNHVCSWNCIFNFANNKNFFCVSFSKNVFVFWKLDTITNFEFKLVYIRIFIVFSIWIRCDVNWFHFNSSMNCVIVFINNII